MPDPDQPGLTARLRAPLSRLGPGLITGAADDDPSGIATYSQGGAQAGFGLLWTLLLWPLSWLLRRGDAAQSTVSAEVRRLRLYERGAAAVGLVYLIGWYVILQPILANQVGAYNESMDGLIRVFQVWGLLVIAAAGAGLWIAF